MTEKRFTEILKKNLFSNEEIKELWKSRPPNFKTMSEESISMVAMLISIERTNNK